MSELPEAVTQKIFIDYLFKDFVYKFKNICRYELNDKTVMPHMDEKEFRINMVELLKNLEPRLYFNSDGIIQDQFEEVFELFYIMNGKVGVGYRIFNDVFLGIAMGDR